jgi:hypothetical protein
MIDKSTLDGCLRGISFPASGDEIAECASGNGCSGDVTSQMSSFGSERFSSEEDLLCRLGNHSYCSSGHGSDSGSQSGGSGGGFGLS